MIDKSLDELVRPIDQFRPHPRNPRQGDLGAIVTSLRRFGQVRPILALPNGTIVAGNHVWRAAVQLGWTQIAAVTATMDEATADAYLIADNRLSDLGTYDDRALAAILTELAEAGSLEGTGYDGDDVDALLARLAREDSPKPAKPEEGEGIAHEWHECPSCGHQWLGPAMPARITREQG